MPRIKRYGVPPEIVVGILGVETLFGRQTGGFRVLDALATLSFNFPHRPAATAAQYFRSELEQFLVLAQRDKADALLPLKGSFAGAMGWPQFMPSSWLKYAVDFDGDGRVDLHTSVPDVIGSIANYLATFGWREGLPTHYEVVPPTDEAQRTVLLAPDILPSFSAAQFAERGAALSAAGQQHEGLLALVELKNGDAAPAYVAGTANFYAITRYNFSSYYAMADHRPGPHGGHGAGVAAAAGPGRQGQCAASAGPAGTLKNDRGLHELLALGGPWHKSPRTPADHPAQPPAAHRRCATRSARRPPGRCRSWHGRH